MLPFGHQLEQVHHVDEPHLQVGELLPQNRRCRQGFHGGDVSPQQAITTSGMSGSVPQIVVAGPIPDADAFGAVLNGFIHGQILQVLLLVGDNDVDVVHAAEAVVGHR